MSQAAALSMLSDEAKRDMINSGDILQVYKIAHPGKSNTTFPGIGTRVLGWAKSTIRKLSEFIKSGIPVFYNHAITNAHKGRKKIGEIIKGYIDSEGHLFAIVRKFKEFAELNTDIASFEGPLLLNQEIVKNSEYLEIDPSQVGGISGLALASSKDGPPAFAEARVQCSMQMLERREKLTKEDLLAAIKEADLKASDLFKTDELLGLPQVKEELDKRKGQENLYNENQRLKEQIEKLKSQHESELLQLKTQVWSNRIKDQFQSEIKSENRKSLTDRERRYLEFKFEKSPIPVGESPEKSTSDFIDESLKEFKSLDDALSVNEKTQKKEEGRPGVMRSEIPDRLKNLPGHFESEFGQDGFPKE